MQDDNRFLKINFEEPKNSLNQNTMDAVHVLFYSEKNVLIQEDVSFLVNSTLLGKPKKNYARRTNLAS